MSWGRNCDFLFYFNDIFPKKNNIKTEVLSNGWEHTSKASAALSVRRCLAETMTSARAAGVGNPCLVPAASDWELLSSPWPMLVPPLPVNIMFKIYDY